MEKKRIWQAAGLLAVAALIALALYQLRLPCLILRYTGFYCAGCGTQRMVSALLSGDISGALRQNPFMFAVLPLCGAYLLRELWLYAAGKPPLYKKRWFLAAASGIAVLALVFTVLRNLPGLEFLGPV